MSVQIINHHHRSRNLLYIYIYIYIYVVHMDIIIFDIYHDHHYKGRNLVLFGVILLVRDRLNSAGTTKLINVACGLTCLLVVSN